MLSTIVHGARQPFPRYTRDSNCTKRLPSAQYFLLLLARAHRQRPAALIVQPASEGISTASISRLPSQFALAQKLRTEAVVRVREERRKPRVMENFISVSWMEVGCWSSVGRLCR
jgi:hypothetical protein